MGHKMIRELVDFGSFKAEAWTAKGGRYLIWSDGPRWRWALRDWPDDGLGLRSYGSGRRLAEIMAAINEDHRVRTEGLP